MPAIPKLDTVLELRIYRGVERLSSETVFARRTLRASEHAPRTGARPTKLERVRYELHEREDARAALVGGATQGPVRLYDGSVGVEYVVNSFEALPGGRRMVASCTAFVPSQA